MWLVLHHSPHGYLGLFWSYVELARQELVMLEEGWGGLVRVFPKCGQGTTCIRNHTRSLLQRQIPGPDADSDSRDFCIFLNNILRWFWGPFRFKNFGCRSLSRWVCHHLGSNCSPTNCHCPWCSGREGRLWIQRNLDLISASVPYWHYDLRQGTLLSEPWFLFF